MAPPVARQERHLPASDRREEEAVGRRPVRRVDLDLAHVLEQRVEPRPTEDADLCLLRHAGPPPIISRAGAMRADRNTQGGTDCSAARTAEPSATWTGVPTRRGGMTTIDDGPGLTQRLVGSTSRHSRSVGGRGRGQPVRREPRRPGRGRHRVAALGPDPPIGRPVALRRHHAPPRSPGDPVMGDSGRSPSSSSAASIVVGRVAERR